MKMFVFKKILFDVVYDVSTVSELDTDIFTDLKE